MGTRFDECPNCGHKPDGLFGGTHFAVYQCKQCGRKYCFKDGSSCPNCGSQDKRDVGEVWAK